MSVLPIMTSQMRQSLGKILNSYIPDWGKLDSQASQAIKDQKPIAKIQWVETDSYRSPIKGLDHDIWQIEDGICLRRHPTLIENIITKLLGLLDILFSPFRVLQKKIEEIIFILSSKFGQAGGILAIPFAILLMIIDFFRNYIIRVLGSITNPFSFIRAILSLPIWLIKTLISRVINVFMAPLLSRILTQIQKTQQVLIGFLAKYNWLRGILLGMIRYENRPDTPIIISKKAVSEVVLKKKWSLFGFKTFLLVIEGDRLNPGFGKYISLCLKKIIFPYYWERTVHMMVLPKKEMEIVKSAIEDALRYNRIVDEIKGITPEPVAHTQGFASNGNIQDVGGASLTNYCPKCNSSFTLAKKFCGKCGVPLVRSASIPIKEDVTPPATFDVVDLNNKKTKGMTPLKTRKTHIWIAICVIVLIIAGAAGYSYFSGVKKTERVFIAPAELPKPPEITTVPEKAVTPPEQPASEPTPTEKIPPAFDKTAIERRLNGALRNGGLNDVYSEVSKDLAVTLKGTVDDPRNKVLASNIAESLGELKEVKNEIVVKASPPPGKPDKIPVNIAKLEEQISIELKRRGLSEVYVEVDKGLLATLNGFVNDKADESNAINIAKSYRELRSVKSNIQLREVSVKHTPLPIDISQLENELNVALKRKGLLDVYAEVDRDLVATLKGFVKDKTEESDAINITKSYKELRDLRNNIQVKASTKLPKELEAEINNALRKAGFRRVNAYVNDNFEVTLKGIVLSQNNKDLAFKVTKSFKEVKEVYDNIFVGLGIPFSPK